MNVSWVYRKLGTRAKSYFLKSIDEESSIINILKTYLNRTAVKSTSDSLLDTAASFKGDDYRCRGGGAKSALHAPPRRHSGIHRSRHVPSCFERRIHTHIRPPGSLLYRYFIFRVASWLALHTRDPRFRSISLSLSLPFVNALYT